jgi:hypothetical protein
MTDFQTVGIRHFPTFWESAQERLLCMSDRCHCRRLPYTVFLHRQRLMNASPLPEVLLRQGRSPQADLPLETEGVLRFVWSSRWGDMLIEVAKGETFVNGQRVDPPTAPATSNIPGISK